MMMMMMMMRSLCETRSAQRSADADDVRLLLDQDCTEARFLHDQE